MGKRLWIALGCFLFPSSAYPTTIVVVARNGSVYIGADSKRTELHASGKLETRATICKVQKYGTVVLAHYGAAIIQLQTEGTHWMTLFDGDSIAQQSIRHPGNLAERADRLERDFWPVYQRTVGNIFRMALRFQPAMKAEMQEIDFVIAGQGASRLPEAVVLRFSTDFRQFRPAPQKLRWSIPREKSEIVLGGAAGTRLDLERDGVESGILSYLNASSRVQPKTVGAPFTIARINPDGEITYDQAGACQ